MKKTNLFLFAVIVSVASSCAVSQQGLDFQNIAEANQTEVQEQTFSRQVIYTADMEMAVLDLDSAASQVMDLVSRENGLLFTREGYKFTFKLDPEKLEPTMQVISLLGEVKKRVVSSSDITDKFYDTQIRLENAQSVRKRYLQLLDLAQNLNEVLRIEKELERINREIDLLTGQMNRMKSLVAQATLNLELKKQTKLGVIGHLGNGVFKGVKWLFVTNK